MSERAVADRVRVARGNRRLNIIAVSPLILESAKSGRTLHLRKATRICGTLPAIDDDDA
jgi:hypothetical protein